MKDYIIVTDSTIDLTDEMAKELGILVLPMTFTIDGKEYKNYLDGREIGLKEFYQKMVNGSTPKTAQLNVNYIMEHAKPVLDKNLDILYISFSLLDLQNVSLWDLIKSNNFSSLQSLLKSYNTSNVKRFQ